MSLLVRKITRCKWPDKQLPLPHLPADSITKDLKTEKNTISLWEIDSIDQIEDAVLALITCCDNCATMDFSILEKDDLLNRNVKLQRTKGHTGYKLYAYKHYDVVDVTYETLGAIAEYILSRILSNPFYIRIGVNQATEMLISAIQEGRVELSDLSDKMVEHITKKMKAS